VHGSGIRTGLKHAVAAQRGDGIDVAHDVVRGTTGRRRSTDHPISDRATVGTTLR